MHGLAPDGGPVYDPRMAKKTTGTRELDERQERFCQEYLVDLNGTQAAIRAGYAKRSARSMASDLLSRPNIQVRLNVLKEAREQKTGITAERVLLEIYRCAMTDPAEAFRSDGRLKSIHEMPEGLRRAIASFEIEELFEGSGRDREHVGQVKKLKFWDKPRNLEMLGRHLSLFVDRIEVKDDRDMDDLEKAVKAKAGAQALLMALKYAI